MQNKKLEDMTLEELWQLFPIRLAEHNDGWAEAYRDEERSLRKLLPPEDVFRISHIGSTSVPGILSKPIVDILIELIEAADMENAAALLSQNGRRIMCRSENRISLNSGYTEQGFADRVFHFHLRYAGDNDELYFRDYLISHPAVAKEYQSLKLRLQKEFEFNRDGYTDAKTDFVKQHTAEAKAEYKSRY